MFFLLILLKKNKKKQKTDIKIYLLFRKKKFESTYWSSQLKFLIVTIKLIFNVIIEIGTNWKKKCNNILKKLKKDFFCLQEQKLFVIVKRLIYLKYMSAWTSHAFWHFMWRTEIITFSIQYTIHVTIIKTESASLNTIVIYRRLTEL